MPVLIAFRENRFGFRFEIKDQALLGRAPECQLILFDRATSRHHAEIFKTEEGYILKDLGSTNGTIHNSQRLYGEILLKKNDEIRVGQEVFLFDPDLDLAIGPEGAALIVGNVEGNPPGIAVSQGDVEVSALDRAGLALLYQVAVAMASRPKKGRLLKQVAYALTKIFRANRLALLWPETSESTRLTTLLCRPVGRRLFLPRPMVDLVIKENQSVIWPNLLTKVDFVNGQRLIDVAPITVIAVPLKAHGDRMGLIYIARETKPFSPKDLTLLTALANLIGPALVNATLLAQLDYRQAREEERSSDRGDFLGQDDQIKALLGTSNQVSQTEVRILLTGEPGTGKEVLARRIHAHSHRRRGPFIAVNCSALAPGQIESTLFGDEAGSISDEGTPGILEQAEGGTLFLRHVDHLPLSAQVELLRAIEESVVYRIGATTPRPVNFRLISSTTMDLTHLMNLGEFREDLGQRLAEVVLTMPPLREVKGDITTLAEHFMNQSARDLGLPGPELDPAVADCLRAYPWPGNVGELKNLADRLVMFSSGGRIVLDDLAPELRLSLEAFKAPDDHLVTESLASVERLLIRRSLARTNGTLAQAADILGVSEDKLKAKIRRYDLILDANGQVDSKNIG